MELVDLQHTPKNAYSAAVTAVAQFLSENDLQHFENGSYEIDGKNFFVNLFNYTTKNPEERIWEAHRRYIDIHLVLEGEEYVRQSFLNEVQTGEYNDDNEQDYVPVEHPNTYRTQFLLNGDRVAVFYPNDAHQTGVKTTIDGQTIRKAVFKFAVR